MSITSLSMALAAALVMLGGLAMPEAAEAQAYLCNGAGPGEMQVGQVPGDGQGALQALCVRVDQLPATDAPGTEPPGPERAVWQDRPIGSLATDTYEDRLMYTLKLLQTGEAVQAELAALQADPRYALFHDGGWEVFRSDDPRRRRGEGCTALYASPEGLVVIANPSGFTGALLTFIGGDIPVPDAPALVPVTLMQTGMRQPTTVRAHTYRMPETDIGAITFAVPSMQAAVDGMFDVADFQLSMQGRTVMTLRWQGGQAAKDRLALCADPL